MPLAMAKQLITLLAGVAVIASNGAAAAATCARLPALHNPAQGNFVQPPPGMVLARVFTVTGKAHYTCTLGTKPGEWYHYVRRRHTGTVHDDQGNLVGEMREMDSTTGTGAVLLHIDTTPPKKPSDPFRPELPDFRPPPPDIPRPWTSIVRPPRPTPPRHSLLRPTPPMPTPPMPTPPMPTPLRPTPPRPTTTLATTTSNAIGGAPLAKRNTLPAVLSFVQTGKTPAAGANMEWASYALAGRDGRALAPQHVLLFRVLTKGGAPTRGSDSCHPEIGPQVAGEFTAQYWVYEDPRAPSPLFPTGRVCAA